MNSKLISAGCFGAAVLSVLISASMYISSDSSGPLVSGVILALLLAGVGLRVLLKDDPQLFRGILALSLMIMCGAFGVFICVCLYDSGSAGRAAIYIGIGFGILCAVIGICMLVQIKKQHRVLYSPNAPLTKQTAKKVREAYAFHRGENDPKLLIEKELAPDIMLAGGTAYLDRLMTLIDNCGCSRDEFNLDYYNGEIFRGNMCMLNVGDMFTVYCDIGKNQFVFRTDEIIYVGPYVETNNVSGMEMQSFYIKLRIKSAEIYHVLRIAPFMDRPVLDSFRKRRSFLDPECVIFDYPY